MFPERKMAKHFIRVLAKSCLADTSGFLGFITLCQKIFQLLFPSIHTDMYTMDLAGNKIDSVW